MRWHEVNQERASFSVILGPSGGRWGEVVDLVREYVEESSGGERVEGTVKRKGRS